MVFKTSSARPPCPSAAEMDRMPLLPSQHPPSTAGLQMRTRAHVAALRTQRRQGLCDGQP